VSITPQTIIALLQIAKNFYPDSLHLSTSTHTRPRANFSMHSKAPLTTYSLRRKTSALSLPSNPSPTPPQSSAQSVLSHCGPNLSPHHPSNHRTGSNPASADSSSYHSVFPST
jgi:hypothetical protein